MLDLDAFPLKFHFTCKQTNKYIYIYVVFEHSRYMILVRMLRTRFRGLGKYATFRVYERVFSL